MQLFALFPWKTEFLTMLDWTEDAGVPKAETPSHRSRIPRTCGTVSCCDRYPNELSGGMQQGLGVVRALANRALALSRSPASTP